MNDGGGRKVFICSENGLSDSGGVERVMLYASRALAAGGYKPRVIDRSRLGRSAIGKLFAPWMRGPLGSVASSLAFSLLARSLARKGDLLVTNGYGAFLARADLLFCHGSMRGLRRAVKGRRTLLWTSEELLELVAGRRAHRVVAVSHKAAAEWRSLYGTPGDRLRVLANCVDATAFTPDGATRRRDGELRVLFVGRLELRKGPDCLSALADHADDAAPDLRLTIASPNAAGIGAFARRPNVRVLTGLNFKELPELYREHDVHYLPSRYEGFEMVTLEALASGTPVVGPNVGGMAELSRAGFPGVTIAPADDAAATLRALRKAAHEWRPDQRKSELHARVEAEFGVEAWSRSFLRILEESRA